VAKDGTLAERLRRVEALVLDVDGVLTDGSIVYAGGEPETKAFSVRDGFALKLWKREGGRVFIITGRRSAAVERRANELGVDGLVQGADSKGEAFRVILEEHRLHRSAVAAIGDDWPDLPLILGAGVGMTPPEAHEDVRSAADYVTKASGGRGAVAEAVEVILQAKGVWRKATDEYRRPA
jgi:3-deoxy-D-manno-octulosonate 8-phosphate phosphatase (KDO 8-P phosphatase)